MDMKKRLHTLSVIGLAMFLAAFSGQEKFVELEGYLNGRSSAAFRRSDKNVKTVLSAGTRGEIITYKKMKSGNYGLQVKVLSGPKKGEFMWVYYNVNNPDLKLYDVAPQSWPDYAPQETTQVEAASGVETLRDTPAVKDATPGVENGYSKDQSRISEAAKANEELAAGIEQLNNIPVPTARPECDDCQTTIRQDVDYSRVTIARGTTGRHGTITAARCDAIMNNKGQLGELGKYMYKQMSNSRYRGQYLKSNALGAFCPRFNQLTEDQKLLAWTWMWTALGQRESHCEPEVKHTITPKPGRGIWAMETRLQDRAWRGSACKDVAGAFGQALCSIDIMYKTTLQDGQSARGDRTSYWSTIMDGLVDKTMKRFELCY